MKYTLVTMAAIAALTVAPLSGRASDKEVKNAHYAHACACKKHQQVALFVSGRGVGQSTGPTMTVTQTGNGQSITFFR
jgi:hypothetical protein